MTVLCFTSMDDALFDEQEAEAAMRRRMDDALFNELIEMVDAHISGDLTILKFTNNWYVGFIPPTEEML